MQNCLVGKRARKNIGKVHPETGNPTKVCNEVNQCAMHTAFSKSLSRFPSKVTVSADQPLVSTTLFIVVVTNVGRNTNTLMSATIVIVTIAPRSFANDELSPPPLIASAAAVRTNRRRRSLLMRIAAESTAIRRVKMIFWPRALWTSPIKTSPRHTSKNYEMDY